MSSSESEPQPADETPEKPPPRKKKMTFRYRVKIINAMEKGKSQTEVAKEFGISPYTAGYIYKNKNSVIKTYKEKFSHGGNTRINLDRALLNWFELQISADVPVNEKSIRRKCEEIARSLNSKKFKCTTDWLSNFVESHNIIKFSAKSDEEQQKPFDWSTFGHGYEEKDIYVGGTLALLHRLGLQDYLSGAETQERISLFLITNITGCDKKQLAVVGKNSQSISADIKSLPILYYDCNEPLLSNSLITNYLTKWDYELQAQGKSILLALDLPEYCKTGTKFDNIKLVSIPTKDCYMSKMLEKVIMGLRYHYRRLSIMRVFSFRIEMQQSTFLEYVRLLSLAWQSVASSTIHRIFHPLVNGCYYFNTKIIDQLQNEENDKFSLWEWCNKYDVPLQLESNTLLDQYVFCDSQLKSFTTDDLQILNFDTNDSSQESSSPVSALDAFQAIKRLIRYLQSESCSNATINSAYLLDNHLEYRTISEIRQRIEYVLGNDVEMDIIQNE